jgi:DNA-binding transcriptional MerR regulator
MTEDLIAIGRFAQASRLSRKALRLYDESGLLRPVRVDAETGYRWYAWQQVRPARRIALLREAGMPLAEIGAFLADPRRETLDAYRGRVEAELADRLRVLEFVRATTEEDAMVEVTVTQMEEQPYVSRIAERLAQDDVEQFVKSTLQALAGEHEPAGAPWTLYHGLAPEAERADGDVEISPVEACLPTADGDRVLPAAEVASAVVRGDQCRYPQIVGAYDAVWEWARENGRELAGPPREIYRVFGPGEERVFEIAWPLRPEGQRAAAS